MLWEKILAAVIILGLGMASVAQRSKYIRRYAAGELPTEPISSPFSLALGQLLGVAGGIYLVLVMLVSFLGVAIPERVAILSVRFDPLAVSALILALVQPFLPGLRR
ncbi:MAG: hypothetical protein D9V47_06465 [Clostridia bacterium]|nr:MAG: hypothetical protein D9V47_06465 [Clostridia bacterium]